MTPRVRRIGFSKVHSVRGGGACLSLAVRLALRATRRFSNFVMTSIGWPTILHTLTTMRARTATIPLIARIISGGLHDPGAGAGATVTDGADIVVGAATPGRTSIDARRRSVKATARNRPASQIRSPMTCTHSVPVRGGRATRGNSLVRSFGNDSNNIVREGAPRGVSTLPIDPAEAPVQSTASAEEGYAP